jgi:hypothetical protein
MLVAAHVPAHDDERQLAITTPGEVGYRLSLAGENGEPESLVLPGNESGVPGTHDVTLAGDGQSTRTLFVIFLTDAALAMVVPRWRNATDHRLTEIDAETE